MALSAYERSVLIETISRGRLVQRVLAALSPKQREFARERAKRVAAHCGRRSGKSHGIAGRFFLTAIAHPGELGVYIATSAGAANELIELAFRILGQKIGWAPHKTERKGNIYWVFPNGFRLWVAGCRSKADAEKFRGPRYAGCAIDECDSIRGHLRYLVDEVLDPATLDLDGWIALTGTPGPTPAGYFYDVTTGSNDVQKWATYHWTCRDNPFLKDPEGYLRIRREKLGLDETSASYRREYLGQWVKDLDALVYAYDGAQNSTYDVLDTSIGEWTHVIGIDLGVNDATALVAGCYRRDTPYRQASDKGHWTGLPLHILEAQSWTGLSPSEAYYRLKEWMRRYPHCRVVADTGGQGKAFTREWETRFSLFVESAPKLDVVGQVAFVNGLLRTGQIKLHLPASRTLAHEITQLPWNEERTAHESGYSDHEADAFRYCILAMRPNYRAEPEPPAHGTPEWYAKEAADRKEKAIQDSLKRGNRRRFAV